MASVIEKTNQLNPAYQQSKKNQEKYNSSLERLEKLKTHLAGQASELENKTPKTKDGIPVATVDKYLNQVKTYTDIKTSVEKAGGQPTAKQESALANLRKSIINTRKKYPKITEYQQKNKPPVAKKKTVKKPEVKQVKPEVKTEVKENTNDDGSAELIEVVKKYDNKYKNNKTTIKVNNNIKNLAGTDGQTINVNIEAILDDYNKDMPHILGKGDSPASAQKKEAFKDIDVEGFKNFISKNGGAAAYVEFIIEHELQHVRQKEKLKRGEGVAYPRDSKGNLDLMHPDAIALEKDANLAGFKAIGFTTYNKGKKETRELTPSEQHIQTKIDKVQAKLYEIKNKVKDFVKNSKYQQLTKRLKKLKASLKIETANVLKKAKAEVNRKKENSTLYKIADKVFAFPGVLGISDLFRVREVNRTSFFSENTDETLTATSIARKLKNLGITDKAYIKAVATSFTLFKKQFNEKVLPESLEAAKLNNGPYITSNPEAAFYVKELPQPRGLLFLIHRTM